MIVLKDNSIDLTNMAAQLTIPLHNFSEEYGKWGLDCVITCGKEGEHGPNSLHPVGRAVDIRTWHLLEFLKEYNSQEKALSKYREWTRAIASSQNEALMQDYDIVFEEHDNVNNDHIHIEYDPKERQ